MSTPNDGARIGPSNGISGGYKGDNRMILRSMTAFSAIAWYNSLEILALIFIVFKKYKGLYFWSLFLTTLSIIPYQLGVWMKQNRVIELEMLSITLSSLGWLIMVPGQSFVLYSRLHLVTQNERLLRFILWLIIINAVVLCIPTIVLTYGSNTAGRAHYLGAYAVIEKAQMTIFTVQEFFISGVYLWEVRKILKTVFEGGTRELMWQLALINVIIIGMDIALLTVEFCNFYQIETTSKGMIYSIKLKLEFGVLSKLVEVVTDKNDRHRVATVHRKDDKHELGSFDIDIQPSQVTTVSGMHKSTSHLLKNGTQTQHVEYSGNDENIVYADWRMGSDVTRSLPTLLDEIERFKQQRSLSRRSSIDGLYPGRLGAGDWKI